MTSAGEKDGEEECGLIVTCNNFFNTGICDKDSYIKIDGHVYNVLEIDHERDPITGFRISTTYKLKLKE